MTQKELKEKIERLKELPEIVERDAYELYKCGDPDACDFEMQLAQDLRDIIQFLTSNLHPLTSKKR